jgi:hypothetical protein
MHKIARDNADWIRGGICMLLVRGPNVCYTALSSAKQKSATAHCYRAFQRNPCKGGVTNMRACTCAYVHDSPVKSLDRFEKRQPPELHRCTNKIVQSLKPKSGDVEQQSSVVQQLLFRSRLQALLLPLGSVVLFELLLKTFPPARSCLKNCKIF